MRIRAPTDTPAPAFPDPRPPPGHRRTAPQPGPAGPALTPGRAPPPCRPPAGASHRGRRPGRAAARTRSGPRPRGRRRRAPGRASTRCLAEASAASPSGPRPTASAVIPSPWPGRRHCRGSASGSGRRRRCPTRPRARALPPLVGDARVALQAVALTPRAGSYEASRPSFEGRAYSVAPSRAGAAIRSPEWTIARSVPRCAASSGRTAARVRRCGGRLPRAPGRTARPPGRPGPRPSPDPPGGDSTPRGATEYVRGPCDGLVGARDGPADPGPRTAMDLSPVRCKRAARPSR